VSDAPSGPAIALDLTLHPDDAAAFWRAAATPARRSPVRIVWHDSPERLLAQEGLALAERVGKHGGWRLETLRPPPARSFPGRPAALLRDGASAVEIGGLPEPLAVTARFEGGVRRAATLPAGVLALEMLGGSLSSADGGSRTVCRVALSGEAEASFALARSLAQAVRLLPAPDSLAMQALRVPGAKHGPAVLEAGSVGEALAAATGQLGQALLDTASRVDPQGGPEPVHQMRVALRRLRSAIKVLAPPERPKLLDEVEAALRELAQALGAARDWDVFVGGLGRDSLAAFPGEPAVARLMKAAERCRLQAYAALAARLDAPEFRLLGLSLAELASVPTPLPEALGPFAATALSHRLRKAVKAGRRFGERTPEERHALRLRCKRLRYAAEMFAPLFPGQGAKPFLHRLTQVQDRLGALNDAAVTEHLLAGLPPFKERKLAVGLVRGYATATAAAQLDRAARSWKRFQRCDPFWR
jgi:CHAD domain-containing protein